MEEIAKVGCKKPLLSWRMDGFCLHSHNAKQLNTSSLSPPSLEKLPPQTSCTLLSVNSIILLCPQQAIPWQIMIDLGHL